MPGSVNKLQGLDNKFDVANTAAPKLYVAFEVVRANDIALNTLFDVGNFIQQVSSRAPGINKRLVLTQEFVSQLTATGDSTGLDKGETFPGFTEPGVIIFHAVQRAGQRPCRAFRPQTQIHAEKRAGWMRCRKRFEDFFSQPVKEFVIRNVRRELPFLTVKKKKI